MVLEERYTTYAGGRVRYLYGGTGPALILCHGWIGSAENFETWFDDLQKIRTLVIPDLPGCGESAVLPGTTTPERMALAVEAVRNELDIAQFDLGGLCLGTSVALSLAAMHRDAVRHLLLHTPVLAPGLIPRRFHWQVGFLTSALVYPATVWLARQRLISDLYKRLVVEGSKVDTSAADMNFRNHHRANPQAAKEWMRNCLRRNDLPLLGSLDVPTMMILAVEDKFLNIPKIRAGVGHLPHVSMVEINEAGHGWTKEYVRRQLLHINAFLQDLPSPSDIAA